MEMNILFLLYLKINKLNYKNIYLKINLYFLYPNEF